MAALPVWSRVELDDRERVFQALVAKSLRLSARALEDRVVGILVANTAPEPEARSAAFTLALGEVGTVQATWTARVDSELMPYLAQTFADAAADAGKMALDVAGRSGPTPTAGFIDRVLSFLRDRLVALGGWLATKLGKIIQAGYDRGDELRQLATGVRAAAADALPVAAGAAADALGWASTLGELTQLQAAGFTNAEVEKQWLTADDDRVRPAHEEADGQRVGLFEMFDVGNERLFAPRDPTGRPDNVIGCRCSLGYIFNDVSDSGDDGDAELTAAADPDWDEGKHPRAPKGTGKGGQFISKNAPALPGGTTYGAAAAEKIEKATSAQVKSQVDAAKIPAGKPIKVNTNVIYKTKYDDGAVVAVNPNDATRLRWAANEKKFFYQRRQPAGNWQTVAEYGKGDAYKKFSKEDGWHAPAPATSSTPKLTVPTAAPPVPLVTPPPPSVLPRGGIPQLTKMSPKAVVAWLKDLSQEHYDGFTPFDKMYIDTVVTGQTAFDGGAAKKLVDKLKAGEGGDWTPPTAPLAALPPAVVKSPTAGTSVPLKINTAVVYKTKYAHGAVVAVKPGGSPEGLDERLTWNETKKKFTLERYVPGAGWSHVKDYNKGQTYKTFSDETNWFEPGSVEVGLAKPTPVVTPPPPPAKVSALPTNLVSMAAPQLNAWFNKLTQAEYDALSPEDKEYLADVANGEAAFDNYEPYNKLELLKNGVGDSIPGDPDHVVDDLTDDHIDWTDDGPEINGQSSVVLKAPTNNGSWKVVGYAVIENGYIGNDTGVQLYAPDKTYVGEFVTSSPSDAKAEIASKLNDGNGAFTVPTASAPQYLDDHAYGEELFGNTIPQDKLNQLTKTKSTLPSSTTYGPHQSTDLHWNDFGPQIDGNSSLAVKYPKTPGSKDYYVAGYTTYGEGNEVKLYDTHQNYVKSLHADEFSVMKELITDKVNAGDGKIVADADDGDVSVPTPTTPTPTTSSPKYTPGIIPNQKDQLSGYIHQELIPTNDIGVPDPVYSGNYAVVDQTTMSVMQQGMLNKAGKKWTPQEIQAVQRYTTSVGYQTTNAVLRNDQTRLNMFSISQLKDGVKNAQALQSAMTPTIVSGIKVFRGTGAQAFGSPGKDISFDDLKKFEGKTITDDGFVSTTILDEKSTGFDYTKNPIRMEIEVPPGTPALYVSSATPGYSSENELILAAGTTLEIIEVRKATPAEKAAHSNSLKHIVRARVVPSSTGKTGPPAPTGTPVPTTVNPTSSVAPKLATSVPGKVAPAIPATTQSIGASVTPMDLNTTAIYKSKYAHGAVVAVRLLPDGAQRLVWSEIMKKFVFQQWDDAKNQWTTDGLPKITYTKKDAYAAFSKLSDWKMPLPGSTGIGSPLFYHSTPSVAPSPAPPATATPAATAPSAPTPGKMTFDELKNLHGELPATLSSASKGMIYKHFKSSASIGTVTLATSATSIFDALIATQKYAKEKLSSPVDLNLLQVLKLIDEAGTPTGKKNANLYEKKIIDWLQTATGAAAATKSLNAASLDNLDIAELRKQVVKPTDIGTPDVSVKTFSPITAAQASQMQTKMSPNSALTDDQRSALTLYTGSWYTDINGVLRQTAGYKNLHAMTTKKWLRHAVHIQGTMKPIPRDIITYRGTGPEQFGLPYTATIDDIRKFIGKTITDDGFVSTSIDEGSAFGNKIKLIIEAPTGTAARYVAGVSSHSGERELLYAAGTKFVVMDVWDHDPPGIQLNVRLRVVP